MSKIAQDIILRPIITEESMLGTADKKYTFSVAKDNAYDYTVSAKVGGADAALTNNGSLPLQGLARLLRLACRTVTPLLIAIILLHGLKVF